MTIIRTREIIRELDEDIEESQKRKIHQPEVPMILMRFGKCKTNALIDTGAQITAMTRSFYEQLREANEPVEVVPVKKFSLRGAFSERGAMISTKVRVSFEYNDETYIHEFFLVEKLAYEVVIGIDFLVKYRLVLACDDAIDVKFRNSISPVTRINAIGREDAEVQLQQIIEKHARLFDGQIGCVNHYRHNIKMNVARPYKKKTYPIPEKHMGKVRKYIKELEQKGIIRKQATQYVNPLVVVIKKSGDIRLCLDARGINKLMASDHAQPPTIEEVFQRIGKKKVFTTLDVSNAFWQIPLEEDSMQFTGFLFDGQTYVFMRMPFGLKTSGASFTRAMDAALGKQEFLLTYLDDVLIASDTLEEHLFHLDWVLTKLGEVGFKLNEDKCEFLRREIKFLGHTFNEIKAEINQETRMAIANFERPANKKQIQSFLGLINWDRRFIKNMARMTKPLEELLKKGQKFVWTNERQQAFKDIKQAFQEAPDLYIIQPEAKFGIYVDAARTGLGARLYQYKTKSDEKETVGYASRSIKGAELNYTVTELECLALVWALRKWHTLLMGRHVRVHTDHQALKFLSTCVHNNARIARWFAFMQEFDLEIEHLPGKDNEIADTLSRRSMNEDAAQEIRRIAVIRNFDEGRDTSSWTDIIRNAQANDEALQEAARQEPERIYERAGILRVKVQEGDRIALPRQIAWRITKEAHKLLIHFGTDKIYDFVKRYFRAPNLARIARDVVASCEVCQATKYATRATVGEQYYVLPEAPGETLSMDIFGPLPITARGDRYVLVIMDQFSKYVKLYPMKNQKLETIIDQLENEFLREIGTPETILTDNGSQFIAERWQTYAREKGFNVRRTSPYNPQSNPVERVMRELGRIIRAYASQRHHTWYRIIERAEVIINNTTHASHGFTPRELHDGEFDHLPLDPALLPLDEEELPWPDKIRRARDRLEQAARKRKKQADKHGTTAYEIGQEIWIKIHRRSNASRRLARKIHLVYEGPYRVQQIIRPNAYLIEDVNGQTIGIFNARQLKPHRRARLWENNGGANEEESEDSEPESGGEPQPIRQPIQDLMDTESTANEGEEEARGNYSVAQGKHANPPSQDGGGQ